MLLEDQLHQNLLQHKHGKLGFLGHGVWKSCWVSSFVRAVTLQRVCRRSVTSMCLFVLHRRACLRVCPLIWHTGPVSPVLGSSSDLALLLVLQLLPYLPLLSPVLSLLLSLSLLLLSTHQCRSACSGLAGCQTTPPPKKQQKKQSEWESWLDFHPGAPSVPLHSWLSCSAVLSYDSNMAVLCTQL